MKVCLIASNCLEVSPYIEHYMKIVNTDFEYVIIEKRHKKDKKESKINNIETFYYDNVSTSVGKFLRFVKYALFVYKIIQKNKFDRYILFSALNSSICYFFIRHYAKGRYILDIRDYDYSINFPVIKKLFKKVVNESEMIVISSEKFKTWIPRNDSMFVMHNIPITNIEKNETSVFSNDIISISYLGNIGYYNENINLVNCLQSKCNVKIKYYGRYPSKDNIKEYCQNMGYTNVYFGGEFKNTEKETLYSDTDFINAIYGNDSLIVTTALPNKLYDCLYYKIPMIVSKGTYLAEIVDYYNLGIVVDIENDDLYDKIQNYVHSFNSDCFIKNCNTLLHLVINEHRTTINMILEFIRGNNDEN